MENESRADPTDLWIRYTQYDDCQARESLILFYTPLVKGIVNNLTLRLPRSLEPGDLVGYGVMGLIDAIDRFDLSREVKFETYAIQRIRGQIIDSLRMLDLLPRSTHRRSREIQETIAQLSQTIGRTPSHVEVARQLDISLNEYHRRLTDANCAIISLDQPLAFHDGEELTLYDALEDENTLTPAEEIDSQELKTQLMVAIHALPKRDQLLVSFYYNEGLTMKEVGRLLGVSESRVSQMHTKIMFALHGFIQRSTEPGPAIYDKQQAYASPCVVN